MEDDYSYVEHINWYSQKCVAWPIENLKLYHIWGISKKLNPLKGLMVTMLFS